MSSNQKNIVVSGFGGQGVLFLGQTLCYSAMNENKNTTWIPSYGAQMRGGSANCFIVISDNEIASPIFDEANYGIFLSKQAVEKFESIIEKDGLIVRDLDLAGNVEKRDDIEYFSKPFNGLIHKNSDKLLLNIVILGAFIKKTGILKKENVLLALETISAKKNSKNLDLNIKSFNFGYNL